MIKINYDGGRFKSVQNSATGEVSGDTIFHYRQNGEIVTAEYSGGEIARGHLIAVCDDDGSLAMRHHHVKIRGEIMTGICTSTPKPLPDGRIRLYEK